MTHSRNDIAQLISANRLVPSRALGQNFVADANTVRRIVRLAGVKNGDRVIEVGAGLGSLTLALLEAGAHVTAIERDKHLVPVLREVVTSHASDVADAATIVHADALAVDWQTLVCAKNTKVIANLPYNVGTSIVTHVLEHACNVTEMLVMLQKEVVQRMCAQPGNKTYGALSVKVAYFASAKMVGVVPPSVFVPQPDVDSALLSLVRKKTVATDAPYALLFQLVNTGFAQRRKMLRRSLANCVEATDYDVAHIAPTLRAEALTVEDWGRLANAVAQRKAHHD